MSISTPPTATAPGFCFDRDTAPPARPGATTGPGPRVIDVRLAGEWNVDGRIINGGYLQAVAVRAAGQVIGGPDRDAPPTPVAVSTSFAAPAKPGPATVTVEPLRAGRRITAVTATMHQDESVVISSQVTFAAPGTAPERGNADAGDLAMPTVPPAEKCLRVPAEQLPGPPGLTNLVTYAFVPEASAWLTGDTSGGPHICCWLSFSDGRPIDALAASALVDMAPPVCFALGLFGWAPTLQLQVGLFAPPLSDAVARAPALLDLRGGPYDGSVVAEDGLLWAADGTLLARSRQIALAPR